MKKISIIVLGIIVGFIFVEITLRVYFSIVQRYDIEMWKYATKLKQPVKDGRSHIHKQNASAKIMGVDVKINSYGMRDDEFSEKKEKGEYRILLIGDSITFGFGVEKEETFTDLLENKLNNNIPKDFKDISKVSVINTGIGNYNTWQEFEILKRTVNKFEADEVLLAFFINDFEQIQKRDNFFLIHHSITFAFISSFKRNFLEFSSNGKTYKEYYKNLYTEKRLSEWKDIMQKFKELSPENFYVIIIPDLHQLNPYNFSEEHEKIKNILDELNIKYVSALKMFNETDNPEEYWVAEDDAHPNKYAHSLIFKSISLIYYETTKFD